MSASWADIEACAGAVVDLARAKNVTVSTAESCTGGGIGAAITDIGGASAVFPGGLIAYSNDIKMEQLCVPKDMIIKHGAVSREVAGAMAKGAAALFTSNFAVAVTGIAGPSGGSADKPVGLVYVAIARAEMQGGEDISVTEFRFGEVGRSQVRMNTIFEALSLLGEKIAQA